MWGASFADLAKAAQEASEMAAKRAQEASQAFRESDVGQVSSFFNLDAMGEHDNDNDYDHDNDNGNGNGNDYHNDNATKDNVNALNEVSEEEGDLHDEWDFDDEDDHHHDIDAAETRRRDDEERLRIEAANETARLQLQQQREEEQRLRVEAEEAEAARLMQQEKQRLRFEAKQAEAVRLRQQEQEEQRLRIEAEEAEDVKLQQEQQKVDCLRVQAEEAEAARLQQEQQEKEERLRIEAEEAEAVTLQQQEEDCLRIKAEATRLQLEQREEDRLRVENEEAEAARLQHQEEEECLRIEAEEAKAVKLQQEQEEQDRLRIEAEEAEAATLQQQEQEEQERLRMEAEEAEAGKLRQEQEEEEELLRMEAEEAEAATLQQQEQQFLRIEAEEAEAATLQQEQEEEEELLRMEAEEAEAATLQQQEQEFLRIEAEEAEAATLQQEQQQEDRLRVESEEAEAARLQQEQEQEQQRQEEDILRIEADKVEAGRLIEHEEGELPHIEENGAEADRFKEDEEHLRIEAEEVEAACLHVEADNEAVRLREGEDELLFIKMEKNEEFIPQCELEGTGRTGQTDAETAIEDEHQGFDSMDEIEAQQAERTAAQTKDKNRQHIVALKAVPESDDMKQNIADSQNDQIGWNSEDFEKIYDEEGSDSDQEQEQEQEQEEQTHSALESVSGIRMSIDRPDYDLQTGDDSSRPSSRAEDRPDYDLQTGDQCPRATSDPSEGQNPLTSFSSGFSSYIGNMPNMTSGLNFNSYINGTTNEGTEKDISALNPSAGINAMDSVLPGFEPPTDIDELNEASNISISAAEVEAMNNSMARSAQNCDSENFSDSDNIYGESDDIDELYGSESGSESQVSKEKSELEGTTSPASLVPQYAIDRFMTQLERIHGEHDLELKEMENKHRQHMEEMKGKLQIATQSRRVAWGSDVANHDKCLAQLRQLEKDFNAQLLQRKHKISEISEVNTALRRQVEELSLESDGLNQTIQASKQRMAEIDSKDEGIEHLKSLLSATQSDLEASKEAYSTLKSRVKSVATELKDRRVECRTLNISVQELAVVQSRVEAERNDYQMRTAKLEKVIEEKDEEVVSLRKNLVEIRMDLKKKEKELSQKGNISSKALDSYKKKAQASLANSNARAATANQAKEDAEIDATNARNDAEVAMKKAKEAEVERSIAISKAREEVQIFKDQISELNVDCKKAKKELSDAQAVISKGAEEAKEANKNREEMLEEWTSKNTQLESETERASCLEQDVAIERIKSKEFEDEIYNLKVELENYTSAAFMARQSDGSKQGNEKEPKLEQKKEPVESDGTIVMLQQDLKAANDAIRDLKEALGTALSRNPETIVPTEIMETIKHYNPSHSGPASPQSAGDKDTTESTPLFFAFEKQAELNTSRDEITRLAALLGDAESTKMEAVEAMDDMRKKMEEAESRLRRYEKLAPASGRGHRGSSALPTSQNYGNRRSHASIPSISEKNNGSAMMMSSRNDSTVSLEYLKNIMLRYMNATSLNEKRALLPVIGAVLELTPDEQTVAMANVEKSANVTGVGVSLIENIQNKGLTGLFS